VECPKCGSIRVERLPPSQISPKPGYRCNNCGLKMRSTGMLLVYVFVLFGAFNSGDAGRGLIMRTVSSRWVTSKSLERSMCGNTFGARIPRHKD
jgi:DNA-directed RNA polymerase subunit RPC12/RpoP